MVKKGADTKFSHILLDKERIKTTYKIGSYDVLLTNNRVILKKKFLRKLYGFKFKDVEAIEYIRRFNLVRLLASLLSGAFGYVFYFSVANTKKSLLSMIFNVMGWNQLMKLVGIVFFIIAGYNLVMMLMQLYGNLRILLEYNQKPINIYAAYNPQILDMIKKVESERKK